jgi:hypothetical protein
LEEHSGNVRIQHLPKEDRAGLLDPPVQTNRFGYLLLESIDEALADLLGRRSRDLIYDHLATQYRYGREEIPLKIHEFYEFLESMFSSGSRTIGRTIIRRLCDKLGYEFVNVPGFEFFDYLDALRARSERDADNRERLSQAASFKP